MYKSCERPSGRAVVPDGGSKKGRVRDYYEEDYEDEDVAVGRGVEWRRRCRWLMVGTVGRRSGGLGKVLVGCRVEKRTRVNQDADDHQLMQLEGKDVVSSVATVLSDLCGPGEWMPMEKLHAELMEQYGNIWHHS